MKKPVSEIGMRIKSGTMTFLMRKLHNVFVYRAQRVGLAGKGVLPLEVEYDLSLADFDYRDYWWMPLAEIIDTASPGDRNYEHIKSLLIALKSVVVERKGFGIAIDNILGPVRFIGMRTPGGRGKGDRLMVGFQFPKEIEAHFLAPNVYTRMSLYYQTLLKTECSLTLYENCKRYASMPEKCTPQLPWAEWQTRLICGESDRTYNEFKRNFLLPAIKNIEKVTDITIKLCEERAKRRGAPVESIYFAIEEKRQLALEQEVGPVIPLELLERVEKMGVSRVAAERMLATYGEDRLLANIEHVEARLASSTLPVLGSPSAYLRKALTDDYAGGEEQRKKVQKKKQEEGEKARAKQKEVSDQSVAVVVVMPEGDQLVESWGNFRFSIQAKIFRKLPEHFEDATTRQIEAFKGWLSLQG